MSSPRARLFIAALALAALVACGEDANRRGDDSGDAEAPDLAASQDTSPDVATLCDGGCAHGGLCVAPSTCDCAGTGFSGPRCEVDEDECQGEGAGRSCDPQASCANTEGSFTCTCLEGYDGDGVTCVDIDECVVREGACGADADCTNANGTFECACRTGFSGDGHSCAEVDECATGRGGCAAEATCTNTVGGRTCACDTGYEGDGLVCADLDECATDNGGCPLNATCTNSAGGFSCPCATGWSGAACDVPVCAPGCPAGTTCVSPGICTPPAPTGVDVTPADGALIVRWDTVTTSPAIEGYTALAEPGGATCQVDASMQACTLTGLDNGTTYSVTVTATNAAGTSEPSAAVDGTPAPAVTFSTLNYDGMTGYPLDLEACSCCSGTTTQEQLDALCQLAGRTTAITWTTQSLVIDNCYCWGGCSNFAWTSNCCSGTQTQMMVTSVTCD